MEKLPVELLSKIIDYLAPEELAIVQRVSRQLLTVVRDSTLWRSRCFESSFTYQHGYFPSLIPPRTTPEPDGDDDHHVPTTLRRRSAPHTPSLTAAEWDPSYNGEDVNWYAEYVSRHAPISFQWLEPPSRTVDDEHAGGHGSGEGPEIKGMGLLKDQRNGGGDKVVSPLEDGSVCVWDLNRSAQRHDRIFRGQLAGLSNPGILQAQFARDSGGTEFIGVGDCVSIDSARSRAYIAVGTKLNDVDLNTLQVVSSRKYGWSIFALSQETPEYDAPLTVATTLSLDLYDPRCARPDTNPVILHGDPRLSSQKSRLCAPLPPDGTDFASLFQPGPLSVLHPPAPNINSILLVGRFPSVLLYDRRCFPRIHSAIYSGGRLCGSTAIPGPPQRPISAVDGWTNSHTVVTCGEYNGRGSLELYALSAETQSDDYTNAPHPTLGKDSVFQNRQSAARSKILSVASHGTRLVYSDADGMITWVERDARTPVRSWNINLGPHTGREAQHGALRDSPATNGHTRRRSADVARKILPTGGDLDKDELLAWTGDRIGTLQFSSRAHYDAEGSTDDMGRHIDSERHHRQREYEAAMDMSLRAHLDQLNWMSSFGS